MLLITKHNNHMGSYFDRTYKEIVLWKLSFSPSSDEYAIILYEFVQSNYNENMHGFELIYNTEAIPTCNTCLWREINNWIMHLSLEQVFHYFRSDRPFFAWNKKNIWTEKVQNAEKKLPSLHRPQNFARSAWLIQQPLTTSAGAARMFVSFTLFMSLWLFPDAIQHMYTTRPHCRKLVKRIPCFNTFHLIHM